MAKQRYVNTHFWDDSYIVKLDPIKKLLFLYFLTNPLTNIAGCYEISLRRVSFDTGISAEKILEILAEFERDEKMIFRDDRLLILNFIKNQSFNPKILKGVEEIVKCCPDWVKDRLSIGYDSLSHLNLNLNLNRNSILLENERGDPPPAISREEIPVNGESFGEVESYIGEIRAEYKTNILDREDRWLTSVQKAIATEIPAVDFISALRKLLDDETRKYPVTPENVLSAAIERRATRAKSPTIPNVSDAPKYSSRNAEMEARGFPKMGVAVSEATH